MLLKNILNKGNWESSYQSIHINYNNKLWRQIYTAYDNVDGFLFGVIDKSDGSSFSIDCESINDNEIYDYEWCESEYFSRLYNIDNNVAEHNRFELNIGNIRFLCVSYIFQNKKHGKQIIVRGMSIGSSMVMAVNIAWKYYVDEDYEENIPPKFCIFMSGIELNIDLDA